MTTIDIELGKWLEEKRTEKGFSLQQVADKLGVHRSTVHYWEKGKRKMYASALMEYCDVLGVNLEDFIHARLQG